MKHKTEEIYKGSDYYILKFLGLEDLKGISRTITIIILGLFLGWLIFG